MSVRCNSCGKEIFKFTSFEYDFKFYCNDCTFTCGYCSEIFPISEDSGEKIGNDKLCKYCEEETR